MTGTTDKILADEGQRTGHRPGRDPDEPRNSTVCFTVSETEKAMIDTLGFCTNLRRSAILTRIVTTFLSGAMAGEEYERARRDLLAFFKECREAVESKPNLVKNVPPRELRRGK